MFLSKRIFDKKLWKRKRSFYQYSPLLDRTKVRIYLGKLIIVYVYIGEIAQLQRFVLKVGRRFYEPY